MPTDFKLDPFQEQAIQSAYDGKSVIVSAPTGAGKTLIAERIIEHCLEHNQGVIYTAPIKALSNQKFRNFSAQYPENTGILTGDVSINPQAPILIMTTEIFRNSLLTDPERMKGRKWVIFDEIHYLDDIERGTVWEESLILLPPHMHILALSATIPNMTQLVNWISSIHEFPVKTILEDNRPVPLHFFYQCNNEFFSNLHALKKSQHLQEQLKNRDFSRRPRREEENESRVKPNRLNTLIKHLQIRDALPCMYFSFSRRRCQELANDIRSFNFLTHQEREVIEKKFNDLVDLFNISGDPYVDELYPLIRHGIAYHHAGLLPTMKEIIERLFTTGLIKCIFTTETFALGINMPARTVVFDTLFKYYGRFYRYLKTRDFYQIAGRAGRRGIDTQGNIQIRIDPNKVDISTLNHIIYGEYEPISSQFNSAYATILNLYSLMGEKLFDIYPLSFHFYQSNDVEKKQALNLMRRKLNILKSLGYIVKGGLSQKAELAAKVYSYELQVGELYARNHLEKLDPEELFVVLCCLVYEPRKGERKPKLSKPVRKLQKHLQMFMRDIHKVERYHRIFPQSKEFYFHIAEAARAWFHGTDFFKLYKYCSIDEGEIVRNFRMTHQMLREMKFCDVLTDEFKEKIKICMKNVNRDVVDAEKQLRQPID
ncbi:MAG: DEAD/DEAH box helicase [Candidatus Omnitrophica bacterium]|nr:DEAD/DEAH box helicase [Candidatus Omnitrophota bacterium]